MRGIENILMLIKAARFERALIPISYIMIPVAFYGEFTVTIFFLMISCIFTYATGGLINAKADKDFNIRGVNFVIFLFLGIALISSFYNYIITITIFVGFIMGYVYSKLSRKILFGDSIVLPITHIFIPIFSASLILGIDLKAIFLLTLALMVVFATMLQMKNLKGIKGDKKNNYKTLMTTFANGKIATHLLMKISFIIIFLIYFIFNLGKEYLMVVLIFFSIQIFMDFFMNINQELRAHGLTRLIIIALPLGIVLDKTTNHLPLISLLFVMIYLVYYFSNFEVMHIYGS